MYYYDNQWKKSLLAFLLLPTLLFVVQSCTTTSKKAYADNITIQKCWFNEEVDWPLLTCGVLTVPENYNKPNDRKVQLPFIIVRAFKKNAKTVPLLVTGGGGPGMSMGFADFEAYDFGEYQWNSLSYSTIYNGRDLILMDNRGVGSSIPRLDCEEVKANELALMGKNITDEQYGAKLLQLYAMCKKRLEDNNIDLNQYQIVNSVKDIETLRIGLGFKQFNLYGISYGTRVALEYEREFPDAVRSMILDGVYPQWIKYMEEMPDYDFKALRKSIAMCNEDAYCKKRFGGDLVNKMEVILQRLKKTPVTVTVTNPLDFKPMNVIVDDTMLMGVIGSLMKNSQSIAMLPRYIVSIYYGNKDYLTSLIRNYSSVSDAVGYFDIAANLSYSCYDEVPFIDYDIVDKNMADSLFRFGTFEKQGEDWEEVLCHLWGVQRAPDDFKNKYKIKSPILVYSGEIDPVTPDNMTTSLIKSTDVVWHKVWPNIAHGVLSESSCADLVASEFLKDPYKNPFVHLCSQQKHRFIFSVQ